MATQLIGSLYKCHKCNDSIYVPFEFPVSKMVKRMKKFDKLHPNNGDCIKESPKTNFIQSFFNKFRIYPI